MRILSGQARIAGIAGWPVAHSRSPRLHGFWLRRYEVDGAYIPLPIRPGEFAAAMHGLIAAGFAGSNVTMPHKIAAFEICTHLDDTARRAGAVNTLVFADGRITGSNTDGWGFVANLKAHGVDPAAGPAMLLGAGGSARAIAAALQDAGAPVTIVNRSAERAQALAKELPGLRVVPWEHRDRAVADHALIVNTTVLGQAGHPPLPLDLSLAPSTTAVSDIVYVPLETPLLADARARGLKAVEGLGMLLYQAVPGFRTWLGVDPEVDDDLRAFVAEDIPRR